MKILAFSDIHGMTDAMKRLYVETQKLEFDIIVFGGDFTNAWFDGPEEGQKQMDEFTELIIKFNKPFYYVYGNRDIFVKCTHGFCINERDWKIDDITLTSDVSNLDESKILVTHALDLNLMDNQAESLLYLYGHDHVGRIYKNYIDLGFVYRRASTHGAKESLYGCYWLLEIENSTFNVQNFSWDLRKSLCQKHKTQGLFYIPYYWQKDCPLCYNEDNNKLNF